MWTCKKCRESVEDSFDVCWNCGTSKEGLEDSSFRGAVEGLVTGGTPLSTQAETPVPEVLPSSSQAPGAKDHPIAHALVWVLRGLAIVGAIWGLLAIGVAGQAALAAGEVSERLRDLPRKQAAEAAQAATTAATLAVLTACVLTAAAVAFPLAMAEILRLCLLMEANTRAARQAPREKEKRGRK